MKMMHEWFEYITSLKLTPNEVYLLLCIKDKKVPVTTNVHQDRRSLMGTEWMNDDGSITEKAESLISELDSHFLARKKPKTAPKVVDQIFKDFVKEYVEIFPRKRLPSGKLARVHISSLQDPFLWFFEKFNYTWYTVLKATQLYVTEYEKKDYEYMRNSQFFIRKQNTDKSWISDLADYCAMVESGDTDDIGAKTFEEKVN